MQILTIAGSVGNVKEVKDVGNDKVLNFSVAVDNGKDKNGEKREASWFDCALWGPRAEKLAPYIQKGSKLAVTGRPGARAHEGKAYLSLTVDNLTFMSSKSDGERSSDRSSSDDSYSAPKTSEPVYPPDDEVPF